MGNGAIQGDRGSQRLRLRQHRDDTPEGLFLRDEMQQPATRSHTLKKYLTGARMGCSRW